VVAPYNTTTVPRVLLRLQLRVLREVCDIYESSYRIMGDNFGGGEQRATDWHMAILEMNKQINEMTKAHLRIATPLPSGPGISKAKSATGNIYASTSRTV
jgi:hypothetical protein